MVVTLGVARQNSQAMNRHLPCLYVIAQRQTAVLDGSGENLEKRDLPR
jgi:hypothetical protein